MNQPDLNNIVRHFRVLAKEVGSALIPFYGKATGVGEKQNGTLYCDQDLTASKIIINHFQTYFPRNGIIEEESERDERAAGRWCFGADPLDSSKWFIEGTEPDYATLLFLLDGFTPIVSVSYKPEKDEMIWAVKDHGAYIQINKGPEKRLTVSDSDNLGLVVSLGRTSRQLNDVLKELESTKQTDMKGSAKYLEVAKGKYLEQIGDKAVTAGYHPPEKELQLWDIAGLPLVMDEANGLVKDARGNDLDFSNRKTTSHRNGLIVANNLTNYQKVLTASLKVLKE